MHLIRHIILLVLICFSNCSVVEAASRKGSKHRHPEYRYPVAIAAIFQDEAPHMKEWIEFHRLVGVSHFYLFNNRSSDNYLEVLGPYIDQGVVELIDWDFTSKEGVIKWNQIQCNAYKHAIHLAKGKAKWLALLDLDEFLFSIRKDSLPDFLKDFHDVAGIGVNWQMYGTSRVAQIPQDKLLIEMLLLKAPTDWVENIHVKSIVRPETVQDVTSSHFVVYKPGYFQVNANKEPFQGPFAPYVAVDKIRINHYWSKDEFHFFNVKMPRRQGWKEPESQILLRVENLNKVEDKAIFGFVPALRQRMGL